MSSRTRPRGRIVLDTPVFDRLVRARKWPSDKVMADELDLHRSTIARLRANATSVTPDVMWHLADVLGVPVQVLFVREADRD